MSDINWIHDFIFDFKSATLEEYGKFLQEDLNRSSQYIILNPSRNPHYYYKFKEFSMKNDETFYTVWRKNNGDSKFDKVGCIHETEHSATQEAVRLATQNPGSAFIVFKAINRAVIENPVTVTRLTDVPF